MARHPHRDPGPSLEQQLRESEERLRLALRAARMAVWDWDPRTGEVIRSETAAEVMGLPPGTHRTTLEIGLARVHPEDRARHRAEIAAAVESGESYVSQFRYIRPDDGRVIWLEERGQVTRDDQGNVVRVGGVTLDITERRRADEELRTLTSKAHCMLWSARIADWGEKHLRWDLKLQDEEAAQRLLPLEVPPGSSYVLAWYESRLPEDRDRMDDLGTRQIRAGQSYQQEYCCRNRYGDVRWLSEDVQIESVARGRWRAVGVCIDITERKRAELALRESEARFRALADGAPVLIWVDGLEGCEFVNREYFRFLGCTIEDVRGLDWSRYIHPDDAEAYVAAYLQAFQQRAPFEAQLRLRRADGEYRWLMAVGQTRSTAEGEFLGYVGCSVDITDLKRAETALRDADRRKDQFLAMLAHELRNPLAPILNAVQVMRLRGGVDPSLQRVRDVVERQVQHMSRLVDDLLDVSRITQGKIELRREVVDIVTVVQHAVETCRPLLEAREHHLSVAGPLEPVRLEADPTRLEQILVNLLNNAAKFTERGGQIWLVAAREGGQVVLRVRDTGEGIAPELLPHIFDLFAQADQSLARTSGGLGIGLTLVRQLVELHGGSIEAHSAGPGQGSEFVVRLPAPPGVGGRGEGATRGRGEGARERQGAGGTGRLGRGIGQEAPHLPLPPSPPRPLAPSPRRVLVVDDNEDAAESLAELLDLWGHEVRIVHDGTGALEEADRFRPEVVLLDIGLPGMDGYEVARRLREQSLAAELTLVALSGYGQDEDRRQALEAGFAEHLVKPVDADRLQQVLSAAAARLQP